MSNPKIIYTPRADATPETELQALANVYRFILDCHEKNKAAEAHGGEDDARKGDLDDRAANKSIPAP